MILFIWIVSVISGISFACMKVRPVTDYGVIPLPMMPEDEPTVLTTVSTVSTIPTTTNAPTCPKSLNTVPLVADAEFRQLFNQPDPSFNISTFEVAKCSQCADGTASYYATADSELAQEDKAILFVTPTSCNMCICTDTGMCYKPSSDDFLFYLYPYCERSQCGMYFIIDDTVGSFIPVSGDGITYVPVPSNTIPVTDSRVYLKATSIGCGKCIPTKCV